ncbi:HAMP domain-containing histidine kinase [Alkalihalobacillus oceani]|uniref:histidine kinase n=1 Tax=Halalkalibacter oceani TaxID=1653776 RepID=A0A9X2DRR6_9BACI|nr:ATP-binding protein [Halalkalibacter oceani]MCM3715754.1 HAMP domain-containing histidine kinase [Halalkalibacter oceani]
MKLKTWLLLSYFIVMVLPLAGAYFLVASIQAYHHEQNVEEYFQTWSELQAIIDALDDPLLYQPAIDWTSVEELTNAQLSISLYNRDGFTLYSSTPWNTSSFATPLDRLYQDLYKLEQGHRAYSYRQPVFERNEVIGFFEVQVGRSEWLAAVEERSWLTFAGLALLFLVIYTSVILLLNRKLNRRLKLLMEQMTAFANRQEIEEVRTNEDEIGLLTEHFYRMKRQIEDARKAVEKEQKEKEYMIATLSHDLKTPLTSIRAYTEEILHSGDRLAEEERKEYHMIVLDKANYMKQMLDDLLMFTLMQSSNYEMTFVKVEGQEFFEMLVADYEPLCREKGITIHVSCEVSGAYFVNPQQLMRVADNLMSNAILHTAPGKTIWLAVFSDTRRQPEWLFPFAAEQMPFAEEALYLVVQNEGKGVKKEQGPYVFDPLYQADQARTKKESRGTGLGLSITKQIIEKHGGEVWFFSEEESGTCVICRLPKHEGEGEEDEQKEFR